MATIEVSSPNGPLSARTIFTSAGEPASGYLNNIAPKGALCTDTTNGVLYQNIGTLAATVWQKVGLQT